MNVFDISDARLFAEVKSKEWIQEFEAEFNKPVIDMAKAQFLSGIPEEVKANLRQLTPEAMNRFEKKYGGKDAKTI